jgi:ribosomal protein L11
VINLSSSNTAYAQVPATVTVAAGATTASFTITTKAPPVQTVITVTAAITGSSTSAQFKVLP